MNAILGMTRLLLASPLDPEQQSFAETIQDAADGMLTLLNDLLDVERLQRGDIVVRREPFDLHRLVRRSLDLVGPRRQSEAVVLSLAMDGDVPVWVDGDAGRLRQILINLLANALKLTTEGEVRLAVARADSDQLAFSITDTGPGIAAADRQRIFDPFVRLGADGKGGLGLGLAIVRLVVERLGGEIRLVSALGEGTTFTVTVPLPPAPAFRPAPRVRVEGGVVWFVDTASPLRDRCLTMLEALGLDVDAFAAVELATQRLQQGLDQPDAIIVAAAAPDDAVRALVAAIAPLSPKTALLALATSGLRGEAETWRDAGFHGYLPYPASADLMGDALSVLLAAPDGQRFVTTHSLAERTAPALRVLVVDDNSLNLRLASILLERAGHSTTAATDGEQAWRAVAAGNVDAVLMDVQMPVMDGLEATRRIRALAGDMARTPIIAVTANASPSEVAACREAGMDDVVTKPLDPMTLLGALVAHAPRPSGVN